jgi:hypothetical protein
VLTEVRMASGMRVVLRDLMGFAFVSPPLRTASSHRGVTREHHMVSR